MWDIFYFYSFLWIFLRTWNFKSFMDHHVAYKQAKLKCSFQMIKFVRLYNKNPDSIQYCDIKWSAIIYTKGTYRYMTFFYIFQGFNDFLHHLSFFGSWCPTDKAQCHGEKQKHSFQHLGLAMFWLLEQVKDKDFTGSLLKVGRWASLYILIHAWKKKVLECHQTTHIWLKLIRINLFKNVIT